MHRLPNTKFVKKGYEDDKGRIVCEIANKRLNPLMSYGPPKPNNKKFKAPAARGELPFSSEEKLEEEIAKLQEELDPHNLQLLEWEEQYMLKYPILRRNKGAHQARNKG